MTNDDHTNPHHVTPAEYAEWESRTLTAITACVLAFLERGMITPDQAEEYLKESMQ
jgi:hypothetical protein